MQNLLPKSNHQLIWLILVQIYLLCYAIDNKREKKGTFPQKKIANVDFQINFVNIYKMYFKQFKQKQIKL